MKKRSFRLFRPVESEFAFGTFSKIISDPSCGHNRRPDDVDLYSFGFSRAIMAIFKVHVWNFSRFEFLDSRSKRDPKHKEVLNWVPEFGNNPFTAQNRNIHINSLKVGLGGLGRCLRACLASLNHISILNDACKQNDGCAQ